MEEQWGQADAPNPPEADMSGAISGEISRYARLVESLEAQVAGLRDRLTFGLRPTEPRETANVAPERVEGSPLAMGLARQNESLALVIDGLRDLTLRLDL